MTTTRKIAFGAFTCWIGLLALCLPGWTSAQTIVSPVTAQVGGSVFAIVRDPQGRTIVGGSFSTAGNPAISRSNLVRFNADGTVDQTWNPSPNAKVQALAIDQSGNVFAGGFFTSIGGQTRSRIAKLSSSGAGAADATWNPNASGEVYALVVDSAGSIYAGGNFTTIGGQPRNGIAKLSTTATGAAVSTWNPVTGGPVWALALGGSQIYAGGGFVSIGGQSRNYVARLSTTTGSADATWNPSPNGGVEALALDASGNLFVGGLFSTIGGQTRSDLAKVSTSGVGSADATWNAGSNGFLKALLLDGSGSLYLGGGFSSVGGAARSGIAKVSASGNGSVDTTWDPNAGPANSIVYALAFDGGGNPCIGGGFTSIVGQIRSGYACVTPTAPVSPPTCTLTAKPNTLVSGTGGTVTLTANCTGSPTSYSWAVPSGGATLSQGTSVVTATYPASTQPGTYTHAVVATNAGGSSAIASATVTVTAAQAPACTVTATPSSISYGTATTVSLVASCSGSPSSYTWTSPTGGPAVSGTGSTVTASFSASTPVGTYSYSVSGTNGGGIGAAASATVTVSVAGGTPVCVLTAPAYYVVAQAPVTLSASCSPAATSFVWTGGACANTTGSTCVVSPATTTTYSVAGRNAIGTGAADRKTIVAAAQAFPMTVSSSITPTAASATAQIQVRPQDVGATASIYVFAHIPASKLSAPAAQLEKADGPDPCVLAQLLSNGQLIGVSYASMQAYLTAAFSAQSQSVNILNNVPPPTIAGATFYVGYGPNATLMFTNGTFQGAVTIPGTPQCNTALLAAAPARSPDALTGLWWNQNESGWGVHFTQRHGIVFAAMYTYDSAGDPKWYVASSCAMGSVSTSTGTCNGSLLEVRGPAFFNTPFNTSAVVPTLVGSLQVTFQNASNAVMTYGANAQGRTVALTRQLFASGPMPPAIDYTDLWWNPGESGWGLALTQQYGVMFLAWYVYDGTGKPVWYVASNCVVSGSSCSGDLYRTTGPPFGPSFDQTRVQAFNAGTVSISFIDANNATLTYTVNGVREARFITRQVF